MQRRELLKWMTSAVGLSALPAEWLLAVQQARAETRPSLGLRTLNAHQNALVMALSEGIIPETDTPGANGAKVNEFIDLLLTDWYDAPDTAVFLQGLAQVDESGRGRFGKEFAACSAPQQAQLLKDMDDAAMEYSRAQKAAAKTHAGAPPPNFFYTFKRLTLVGYYTSEIGFKKELGKTIIPPGHSGCAPLPEVKR